MKNLIWEDKGGLNYRIQNLKTLLNLVQIEKTKDKRKS
jgi:hypothetical protein